MLPALVADCETRDGAAPSAIAAAESALGRQLPQDYQQLLRGSDGLEGFVAPNAYLVLWSVAELPSLNTAYAVEEFAPGLTLVGTDGGDVGYGFLSKHGVITYVSVPLIGMSIENVEALGHSMGDFLSTIAADGG